MKITVLSENTSISPDISYEHGLSLFIKTKNHNIIFDTGASRMFKDNAVKMGIDISQADIAVISHGHYDHGGGLSEFQSYNKQARIYISRYAFGEYYSRLDDGKMKYIGLAAQSNFNERLQYVYERYDISENIMLFSGVLGDYPRPSGNENLFVNTDDGYMLDDFKHEQNLAICEGKNLTLVAGCAHSGIINIIEHFHKLIGSYPTSVIGGFHLSNHRTGESENAEKVILLAEQLLQIGAKYYTCHCTGHKAYEQLHSIMGDKMQYLAAGRQITIE